MKIWLPQIYRPLQSTKLWAVFDKGTLHQNRITIQCRNIAKRLVCTTRRWRHAIPPKRNIFLANAAGNIVDSMVKNHGNTMLRLHDVFEHRQVPTDLNGLCPAGHGILLRVSAGLHASQRFGMTSSQSPNISRFNSRIQCKCWFYRRFHSRGAMRGGFISVLHKNTNWLTIYRRITCPEIQV
ncbi:hypothetical protein GALMADRAFT_889061 [Galerina marginata CBS 339.88]|uniref:Uncharacterized protein n=1 Tax=Galerina marginata (strain CBS 339.88) TaxID=685588 RepID=A0A067SJE5_GALM3|nr:hypothetical protein GALMADRAFT_889061 [Galerina marginata CBS 339.88]